MARLKPASGFVLAVAGAISLWGAQAMANDELLKMQEDPKQWVMPLGNYASTRYSELDQITNENVKNLQVAWTFSTGVLRGHEGGPLVIGDMMYVHTPFPNIVFALDLSKGGQIVWKYEPQAGSERHSGDVLRHGQSRRRLWRRQDLPAPGRHQRWSRSMPRPARKSGRSPTAIRRRARPAPRRRW